MRRCLLILAANLVGTGCSQLPRSEAPTTNAPAVPSSAIQRALPAANTGRQSRPTVVLASHARTADDPADFRSLTAFQTQEFAVQASSAAKLLELEPSNSRGSFWTGKTGSRDSESNRQFVLELAADEARNRDAGTALELYYKLAGAEKGRALYQKMNAELSKLAEEGRKAEEVGLKARVDLEELASQLTEVQVEIARFDAAITQLNAGLKLKLGMPIDPRVRLVTDDPLEISTEPILVEEAVKVGLKRRSDLALLHTLQSLPDSQDARRLLAESSPLLAGAVQAELPPGLRFFVRLLSFCSGGTWPAPPDAQSTGEQLHTLTSERERQAEVEIRIAASQMEEAATAARLQAELAVQLRQRVVELRKEQAAGKGVISELTRVHGALRKAEGAVLRAKVDHLSAHAKLRQSQGLLVREVYGGAAP
jgi:hypothetical protein